MKNLPENCRLIEWNFLNELADIRRKMSRPFYFLIYVKNYQRHTIPGKKERKKKSMKNTQIFVNKSSSHVLVACFSQRVHRVNLMTILKRISSNRPFINQRKCFYLNMNIETSPPLRPNVSWKTSKNLLFGHIINSIIQTYYWQ